MSQGTAIHSESHSADWDTIREAIHQAYGEVHEARDTIWYIYLDRVHGADAKQCENSYQKVLAWSVAAAATKTEAARALFTPECSEYLATARIRAKLNPVAPVGSFAGNSANELMLLLAERWLAAVGRPADMMEAYKRSREVQLGSWDELDIMAIEELRVVAGLPLPQPKRTAVDSELQTLLLEALVGKAMTQLELMTELNIRSKETFNGKGGKGGMKELIDQGRVEKDRRVGGYYRPDAPPC